MKIRSAAAVVAVVSVAACAQTPTATAGDHVPAGSSFESGVVFGSGSFVEDGAQTTTTSTVEGDTTERNPWTLRSGSFTADSDETTTTSTIEEDSTGRTGIVIGSGS